jgi:hypothetical protein
MCVERTLGLFAISFLLGIIAGPCLAQENTQTLRQPDEFIEKQQEAAKQNPTDVSFTIRLADDKRQFKQGEIIRLELSFASTSASKYRLDAATYDRSGRLGMDKFQLDPATGFTDPLFDHFNSGMGFIGGGLRGIPQLKEKPYLITCELNEWFRFDQLGHYRLYLNSPRVSLLKSPAEGEANSLSLTSNLVEFEIMPADRAWQAQELGKAVQILAAKDPKVERRPACRILRFLGTQGAAQEMIRRYGEPDDGCGFDLYAGLIGSPQRDFVIERMEAQLTVPTQPIAGRWLSLLVLLSQVTRHRLAQPTDESGYQRYGQQWRDINKRLYQGYAAELAAALSLKQGKAKSISANTLLEADLEGVSLPDVASILLDLPRGEQHGLLSYRWKKIASPALLPVLRRLY